MKKILNILLTFMIPAMVSCIENDLSFPDVNVEITSLDIKGVKESRIDYETYTISLVLEENARIDSVKIDSIKLGKGASIIGELPEYLDLNEPYKFQMKVYEVENWTMTATQPISRYINCDNQVGEATIDPVKKTAFVYIVDSQPLDKIKINSMKLEPEGSVVESTYGHVVENGHNIIKNEPCNFPMVLDCTLARHFIVRYNSEEIDWVVAFLIKQVAVSVSSVNAWTYSAEFEGVTNGKGNPVFEYCVKGSNDWKVCQEINVTGTTARASLSGLEEDTEYSVRMNNGEEISEPMDFRTGKPEQLDNMDFEQWHQADPNDCWYPFPAGQESGIWGTANPGTNFINPMNPTRPEYEHVAVPGGTAVRLESMTPFGVFAAGNIFSGRFDKFSFSDMTAYLEWGTPFKGRPYSLKGYYDYAPKQIDKTQDKVSGKPNPHKDKYGLMDHLQILAVLVDEAENEADKGPFPVVSTKPGVPDLRNDPRVIAFGTIESSENTEGKYKEFECVLEYKDNREPDYVIVVACSSLWGNYFTGGVGSVLYVDDFQFEYK